MTHTPKDTISGKQITPVERSFLKRFNLVKKQPKKAIVPPPQTTKLQQQQDLQNRPIPHLPPYATQYRDLMLSELEKKQASQGLPTDNNLDFLIVAKAAEHTVE